MKIALIVVGLLATILVVGGVVLVAAAPEGMLDALKPRPPRTEVRATPATRQTLVETVSAPGEIEPLTKVEISAEISARIEELPFREGDEVRRGNIVVKLDDRDLRASLEAVKAQREAEEFRLQSEQANLQGLVKHLAFARKTLERQQALFDTGDVSLSTLDDALERVEDLEASVEASTHSISVIESSLAAAAANIDRAEDALTKTIIRAPMNGVITLLNAEIGEVVLVGTMNNPGTVIMTIADLSRMILNARVAESDIAKVSEGQSAKVHINAYPDEVFDGFVRKVALQRTVALDGTGHFETEIELDLKGRRIYSGLVANVDIEIAAHEGIVVESQAIVERLVEDLPVEVRESPLVDRRKRVTTVAYRVTDGKTVCTPVRRGASDLTHSVVLEGIEEGEIVVVGPYKVLESIKHDELVKLEGEGEADADAVTEVLATDAGGDAAGAGDAAAEPDTPAEHGPS